MVVATGLAVKPPLGIRPIYLDSDTENRKSNLIAAISRYKAAGLSYPREWDVEIYVHTKINETIFDIFQSDLMFAKNHCMVQSHVGIKCFYEKSLSARKKKRLNSLNRNDTYFIIFGYDTDKVHRVNALDLGQELEMIYLSYGLTDPWFLEPASTL